jgi:hypothetical protein
MKHEIHRNGKDGAQVEWEGVLLTLQPNKHHGISGSVAIKKDGKMVLLTFHGQDAKNLFPLAVHEDKL